jgi:hypothetical protein
MLIVSTFEHSLELEQALAVLESPIYRGMYIAAVPMSTVPGNPLVFASEASDQLENAFGIGMAGATACAVVGTSCGFALDWGPLLWGLLSAVCGFIFFFSIYRIFFEPRSRERRLKASRVPEVTVIIRCADDKCTEICQVLWGNKAITVGTAAEHPAESVASDTLPNV